MTFTYDATEIAGSSATVVSATRWLLQDTVEERAEISDEEITALYGATSPVYVQAARVLHTALACSMALERKYRKQASFSSGGTSIQHTQRAEAWTRARTDLAAELWIVLESGVLRDGTTAYAPVVV